MPIAPQTDPKAMLIAIVMRIFFRMRSDIPPRFPGDGTGKERESRL